MNEENNLSNDITESNDLSNVQSNNPVEEEKRYDENAPQHNDNNTVRADRQESVEPSTMAEPDDYHNTCVPIKELSDVWNYVSNPPAWSSGTEELTPRGNAVVKNPHRECHVDYDKLHPQQRVNRNGTPKTLVCHDMKGGYLSDRYTVATRPGKEYAFYHWAYIDVFVYFSHHLITIPPLAWINVAHRNGVKILGTVITEWTKGKAVCDEILGDRRRMLRFVEALVDVCVLFRIDGWLLNVENDVDDAVVLKEFVGELTKALRKKRPHGLIIWYDSVTCDGKLMWQNELNDRNRDYFDACDGIFLNYTWNEGNLIDTVAAARSRLFDVYVGLDVFGRNFIGGGKFNSYKAAELIRKHNLSMAIFAPGWTHESLKAAPEDTFYYRFLQRDNAFWRSLSPYLYTHTICQYFRTCFYTGSDQSLYDLERQELQISKIPHSNVPVTKDERVTMLNESCDCTQLNRHGCLMNNTSYRITDKNLPSNKRFVHRLIICDLYVEADTIFHTITKGGHDTNNDNCTAVLLVQQKSDGLLKKVLCRAAPGDRLGSASDVVELFPLPDEHRAVDFVRLYSGFNPNVPGWTLRSYQLNMTQCRILEVGIMLENGSSLLLGGIGIQRVMF